MMVAGPWSGADTGNHVLWSDDAGEWAWRYRGLKDILKILNTPWPMCRRRSFECFEDVFPC
jgi:hypothetical protein